MRRMRIIIIRMIIKNDIDNNNDNDNNNNYNNNNNDNYNNKYRMKSKRKDSREKILKPREWKIKRKKTKGRRGPDRRPSAGDGTRFLEGKREKKRCGGGRGRKRG